MQTYGYLHKAFDVFQPKERCKERQKCNRQENKEIKKQRNTCVCKACDDSQKGPSKCRHAQRLLCKAYHRKDRRNQVNPQSHKKIRKLRHTKTEKYKVKQLSIHATIETIQHIYTIKQQLSIETIKHTCNHTKTKAQNIQAWIPAQVLWRCRSPCPCRRLRSIPGCSCALIWERCSSVIRPLAAAEFGFRRCHYAECGLLVAHLRWLERRTQTRFFLWRIQNFTLVHLISEMRSLNQISVDLILIPRLFLIIAAYLTWFPSCSNAQVRCLRRKSHTSLVFWRLQAKESWACWHLDALFW